MDFCLIAAAADWMWTVYVLMVIVGLGMIIFVHELGHFLVAKACGVRCDKFYLGFDFFGLRLARFQWGETEYGIGIFPLGGYVKMLGQEDNPARLRQELEQARAAQKGTAPPDNSGGNSDNTANSSPEGTNVEQLERALYDPRSYLAKSVPQRMAIISAGVIMNVIFAFVVAVVAYGMGVYQIVCGVGAVAPGEAAWRADLRVGDEILAIDGKRVYRFQDLQHAVSLSERGTDVPFRIRRPGVGELEVNLRPDRLRVIPTVGISNPTEPRLDPRLPYLPGSAAANTDPKLLGGDRIAAVNGTPIDNAADLHRAWCRWWGETVDLSIERTTEKETRTFEVTLPPQPVRTFGLAMTTGPVTAIRSGSPAEKLGIQVGDVIVEVSTEAGGAWDGDPMALPYFLQQAALAQPGVRTEITLRRPGSDAPETIEFELAPAESYAELYTPDSDLEVPHLGLTMAVEAEVQAYSPTAAAEGGGKGKATIEPGDRIQSVRIVPPSEEEMARLDTRLSQQEETLRFDVDEGEKHATWPFFISSMQQTLPGTRVIFAVEKAPGEGDDEPLVEATPALLPRESTAWFFADRGLYFQPKEYLAQGESLGECLALGANETWSSLTVVFRMLGRLSSGNVSPRALVGPVGLVNYAYRMASEGPGRFLLFLGFLSANLAVINFLPIPVLDGGHMMFLIYEGIRGKPVDERVFVGLSYLGLLILLLLMLWVFGLDLNFIPR